MGRAFCVWNEGNPVMMPNISCAVCTLIAISWLSRVVILAGGGFGLRGSDAGGCQVACEWLRNSLTACKSLKLLIRWVRG